MKNLKVTLKKNNTIITNKVTLSYPHLFKKMVVNGEEQKYFSTQILIEKENKELLKAILDVQKRIFEEEKTFKFKGKKNLKALSYPLLKDGDEVEGKPEYKNNYYISCKNYDKPDIIDIHKKIIEDNSSLVYGGAFARVVITLKPYNYLNKTGFVAYIKLVQILGGGKPFGDIVSIDDLSDIETESLQDAPENTLDGGDDFDLF